MSQRLLMRTSSSDEHWNGNYDFAYVKLDEEFAKRLVELARQFSELRAKDKDLTEFHYRDYVCEFFQTPEFEGDESEELEKFFDFLNDEGFAFTEFDEKKVVDQVPEFTHMVLSDYGDGGDENTIHVYWETCPRHDRVVVTTEAIPVATIKAMVL